METTYKKYDDMEISISLKDLLMKIMLKWRTMIVWGLLLALLCNSIGVIKSYQEQKSLSEVDALTNEEYLEVCIEKEKAKNEEIKSRLSQREIEEADRAVDTYTSLIEKYNSLLFYSEHSIKMKLDPNHVQTGYVQYTVDNHYTVEYPTIVKRDNTDSILGALGNLANTDEICQEIASKMGGDIEPAWVKELIATNLQSGNIYISVQGLSKDDCEMMIKIIKDGLNKAESELKKAYGSFDLIYVCEKYGEYPNQYILEDQIACMNNINILKNTMNNLANLMTETQKQYYLSCLDVRSLENNYSQSDDVVDYVQNQKTNIVPIKYIDIKLIVIGLFFGVFIVCAWQGFRYLFTEKIRISYDIENGFGIGVIGEIYEESNGKNSLIDKKIRELFGVRRLVSTEENMNVLCTSIRIAAQKKGLKSIYLTTASSSDDIIIMLEKISNQLTNSIDNVQFGPSIVYSHESLEKMSESECVVIVEKIADSKYVDIKKEIEKCYANHIPILGSIVIG